MVGGYGAKAWLEWLPMDGGEFVSVAAVVSAGVDVSAGWRQVGGYDLVAMIWWLWFGGYGGSGGYGGYGGSGWWWA